MAEIIFPGPSGRIEGRYHHSGREGAPIALVLHPHPLYGGTMNNKIVYQTFHAFAQQGFSVLRINFRGVGRSQGTYDDGMGELIDAAAALDWLQIQNGDASTCWIGGFSFGAWIAMQLMMRRPEIEGFIAVSPPANMYDFSFLAPCPASGLILQGDKDEIVMEEAVSRLAAKLATQRNVAIKYEMVPGADHYFRGHLDTLSAHVSDYLDRRLNQAEPAAALRNDRKRRQLPRG
jgi:alpha/beta superfamily hydrolase